MKQSEIRNRTKAVTEPTAEPIFIDEAKDQLNYVNDAKDGLFDGKIGAARAIAESLTWRSYELKTYKLYLDEFPRNRIELEPAPVRTVESLEYVDSDGNNQTVSTSSYHVDLISEPARITRNEDFNWPLPKDQPNAVIVTFKAGYEVKGSVDTSTDTFTAVDNWFSDDETVRLRVSGDQHKSLPSGLSVLTDYYVINSSGDDFQLATSQGGSAISIEGSGMGQFYFYQPPAIPRSDIDGMLLIVGHLIENREDVMASNASLSVEKLPNGADYLLGLNSMRRPV